MMRGLSARILALSLGLVLLTAVAAGVATVSFARTSARTEQRAELAAQASLVTLQSARLLTPRFLRRVQGGLDGTALTVYDDRARVVAATGPARPRLRARTLAAARRALAGATVSSTLPSGRREVLLEARRTADLGAVVLTRRVTTLTRATSDLVSRILGVLAGALAVAALAAVWLARRIARPLTATAGAARRLANGERGVAVPRAAPGEVGDVTAALTALDAALVTSEGRQREFLLSISHELRTPLTAIRGYGEALADGVVTGDATRGAGATLVAETARLERFTADLLELARLEAEDFSLAIGDVDLGTLADEAATAWRAIGDAGGVTIRLDGFDAPLHALADARRARQVLDGLVENALRATPTGGAVTILAVRATGAAGVAVEDTGPGLSDEDLAEAFTRGLLRERYRETRVVGSGLGLSIATRLAARMGGSVTAEHSAAPPGARFVLRLPAA